MTFKLGTELGEMLVVARFDRAPHVHIGNIGRTEGAIVHYLFDTGPGRGDSLGQISQTTGTIADDGGKSAKPSVGD